VADAAHLLVEVRRVLRPGGRLLVTVPFHGRVQAALIALTRFDAHFDPLGQHLRFFTRRSLAATLDAAGFEAIETWLNDEPATFEPGEPFREYLRTVVLGAHLERLAPGEREGFVDAVATGLASPTIDYVRLNILATRRGGSPD
jgi:trans-aconitate 2-methyltransferase